MLSQLSGLFAYVKFDTLKVLKWPRMNYPAVLVWKKFASIRWLCFEMPVTFRLLWLPVIEIYFCRLHKTNIRGTVWYWNIVIPMLCMLAVRSSIPAPLASQRHVVKPDWAELLLDYALGTNSYNWSWASPCWSTWGFYRSYQQVDHCRWVRAHGRCTVGEASIGLCFHEVL